MILEDSFGSTQLVGIQERHVQSTTELLDIVENANSFRQTASTEKNDGSSRSHAICRIRIENPAPEAVEDGILYLIDLAGSEVARDILNHTTDRMKETREINISLSILKDCIRGMADFDTATAAGRPLKKPYIPFRQSMLTKVLKHLFDPDGNRGCRTSVLACVNPSFLDTGATKNTLRYAEMLQSTQLTQKAAAYNPAVPSTWSNKDLRTYIRMKVG
jgi:kinesin family protein 2/24